MIWVVWTWWTHGEQWGFDWFNAAERGDFMGYYRSCLIRYVPSSNQTWQWDITEMEVLIGTSSIHTVDFPSRHQSLITGGYTSPNYIQFGIVTSFCLLLAPWFGHWRVADISAALDLSERSKEYPPAGVKEPDWTFARAQVWGQVAPKKWFAIMHLLLTSNSSK